MTDNQFPTERQLKLVGKVFTLPMRWVPGAVLNETEALFLNAAYQGSAANAFSIKAKDMIDAGKTDAEIQAALSAFYETYEWSPRGVGESIDPVDREVRKRARTELSLALANRAPEKGGPISLAAQDKDVAAGLVDKWIAKHGERIRKEVLKDMKRLSEQLDDDFLGDLGQGQAAA